MGQINNGIEKIEFAPLASDKGAGTVFKSLGLTAEDSVKLTTENDETKDWFAEEMDAPAFTEVVKKGKTSLELEILNPDMDTLVETMGGSKSGSGGTAKYTFPEQAVTVERTVKITPRKGMGFIYNRARIDASLSEEMGRNNLIRLKLKITALKPEKVGVPTREAFNV